MLCCTPPIAQPPELTINPLQSPLLRAESSQGPPLSFDVGIAGGPAFTVSAGDAIPLGLTGTGCAPPSKCTVTWSIQCPGLPNLKVTGTPNASVPTGPDTVNPLPRPLPTPAPVLGINTRGLAAPMQCAMTLNVTRKGVKTAVTAVLTVRARLMHGCMKSGMYVALSLQLDTA